VFGGTIRLVMMGRQSSSDAEVDVVLGLCQRSTEMSAMPKASNIPPRATMISLRLLDHRANGNRGHRQAYE
jgi:hypothetical protein